MAGPARLMRSQVRQRLRTAQRRFTNGWRVSLTEEEAELWYGNRPRVCHRPEDRLTRDYMAGDVACLVLACKDLLEDAYGQTLKLRVGKVSQQLPAAIRARRKRLEALHPGGRYWLHAAIMLGGSCLAEVRLDWDLAVARGLPSGRRPITRFMAAARVVQLNGQVENDGQLGALRGDVAIPFDLAQHAPPMHPMCRSRVFGADGAFPNLDAMAANAWARGHNLSLGGVINAAPKLGDIIKNDRGDAAIVTKVKVHSGQRGQVTVDVECRLLDIDSPDRFTIELGQRPEVPGAVKGERAEVVCCDDVSADLERVLALAADGPPRPAAADDEEE